MCHFTLSLVPMPLVCTSEHFFTGSYECCCDSCCRPGGQHFKPLPTTDCAWSPWGSLFSHLLSLPKLSMLATPEEDVEARAEGAGATMWAATTAVSLQRVASEGFTGALWVGSGVGPGALNGREDGGSQGWVGRSFHSRSVYILYLFNLCFWHSIVF